MFEIISGQNKCSASHQAFLPTIGYGYFMFRCAAWSPNSNFSLNTISLGLNMANPELKSSGWAGLAAFKGLWLHSSCCIAIRTKKNLLRWSSDRFQSLASSAFAFDVHVHLELVF